VKKTYQSGNDERLAFGLATMQGWRVTMEDAHAAVLDLQGPDGSKNAGKEGRISFFGVYDGHGGETIASYSGENLHNILAKQPAFEAGNYAQALKDGFLATDRAILKDPGHRDDVSGCTATTAVVTDSTIYVGNAGDSRTVLGMKGRAKPLSYDHKPQNEGESARIRAAGGFIDFGRVNGNLALSRAIGDFEFKKNAKLPPEEQIVTAYPDVTVHEISDDDEFLVLACDGIWDCESSQRVTQFVRRRVADKEPLNLICGELMDNCLSTGTETCGVGCDNMTMIIVAILRGKTLEEWYDLVAKRVADGDGPCAPPNESRPPPRRPADFFREAPDEFDALEDRGGRIIMLGDGTEALSDSDDELLADEVEEKDDEVLETVPLKETKGSEGAEDVPNNSERDKENTKIDSTPKDVGTQQDEEVLTKESTAAK